MSPLVVAVAVVAITAVLALVGLTAIGERRRGHGLLVALTAGLFFPLTWVAWYVRDERRYGARDTSAVTE